MDVKTQEAALRENATSVRKMMQVFAVVANKQPVPEELAIAARVAVKSGYFAWMPRAKRYAFTPKGVDFNKQMKRFAPQVNRALTKAVREGA